MAMFGPQVGGMFGAQQAPGMFANRLSDGISRTMPWLAAATAPTYRAQMQAINGAVGADTERRKEDEEKRKESQKNDALKQYLATDDSLSPQASALLAQFPDMAGSVIADRLQPQGDKIREIGGMGYNETTGEWITPPEGMQGATEYGLSPVYGQDAQGNPTILQLGKNGTVRQPELPNGFQLTPGVDRIDLGTAWGIVNRAGDVVGTVPKDIEGAAAAEVRGKQAGESQAALPQTLGRAEQMLKTIDDVRNSPGREMGTGWSRTIDPRSYRPGGPVADFDANVAQLQGQTFLQGYESLKGGGVITEVEGMKAENAIARLQTSQSDEAFLEALDDLEEVVRGAMDRARQSAGGQGVQGGSAGATSTGVRWTLEP